MSNQLQTIIYTKLPILRSTSVPLKMTMSKLIGVFVITLLICSFFQAARTENVRTYRTMLKEILKEKSHENAPSPTYHVPAEILKEKPRENVSSKTDRVPANPYTRGCSKITRCRGGPPRS
ncbi:hypothetical protein RJ640_005716 [Escallonia rubra]|uniref:Uncharacterized protein n=1 Tax=Escallonia rubra TaxID=112253 RepID=A0AA88RUA9_9ASTE|nr:hypothetical protein RJ640_005716 [Escallonia rubra]